MSKLTRFEPIIILLSLALGLALSGVSGLSQLTSGLEEPLFMVLLFFIFLEIEVSDLREISKRKGFLAAALLINFVWTPIVAMFLAKSLLAGERSLQIALVMLLVMPCTDWYLVFTDLTGGNLALSSALLPFNFILQLLLLPGILYAFFGSIGASISASVFLEAGHEILIPLVAAILVRVLIFRRIPQSKTAKLIHWIQEWAEFALVCLIGFSVFCSEGQSLIGSSMHYPMFLLGIVVFYVVNFTLSFTLARILKYNVPDTISLIFTTTARNSALSLILAGMLFPADKVISLAMMVGPVTELPFSSLESFLLKMILKPRKGPPPFRTKNSTKGGN